MDQEVKDKIFELWQQGVSGGEIAAIVGVTRNSVMGFIHRMREKGHAMRSERKLKVKVKEIKQPKPIKEKRVNKVEDDPIIEKEPEVAFSLYEGPVDLEGLKYYSCRFIVEDGNHLTTKYCNKRMHKQSYCKEHYDICYFASKYQSKNY